MTDMTDTVAVAGDRIRSIIERIERIEEEIKDLMETKKKSLPKPRGRPRRQGPEGDPQDP